MDDNLDGAAFKEALALQFNEDNGIPPKAKLLRLARTASSSTAGKNSRHCQPKSGGLDIGTCFEALLIGLKSQIQEDGRIHEPSSVYMALHLVLCIECRWASIYRVKKSENNLSNLAPSMEQTVLQRGIALLTH